MILRFFAHDAAFQDLAFRAGFSKGHIDAAEFLEYRTPAGAFDHAFTLFDFSRIMVARRVFDGPVGRKWEGGQISGGIEISE